MPRPSGPWGDTAALSRSQAQRTGHESGEATAEWLRAERLGEQLYGAARWGDLQLTRSLLRAKAAVDYRGPKFKNSPLMDAASRGYLSVARALIAAGADVDAPDKFGWTAMHHAAKAGQCPIVRLLVASHPPPPPPDPPPVP